MDRSEGVVVSRKFLRKNSLPLSLIMAVVVSVLGEFAEAQAGGAGGPGGSPLLSLFPFLAMLVIVYFLMIRPQVKKQKQHQEFLGKLKRGDDVLTSGGILGRVEGLADLYITLEISPGVRIKVLRSQIASMMPSVSTAATTEVQS